MKFILYGFSFLVCLFATSQSYRYNGRVPDGFEDGLYDFTYKIPAIIWEESLSNIEVRNSAYSVRLGRNNSIDFIALASKPELLISEDDTEQEAFKLYVFHKGKLFKKELLPILSSTDPQVATPTIVDISEEDEIEEDISIDTYEDPYDSYSHDEIGRLKGDNEKEEVYTIVEQMPEYPGGKEALNEYIQNNIRYPEQAKREGKQGTIYLQFVVAKSGELSNIQVVKGIGGGCDEEAIRLIESIPTFNPGMQREKPVNVRVTMPIKFAL